MRRLAPALLLAACATPRGPPPAEIRFAEPGLVEATPLGVELAGKNDEELFAVGTAASAAGDFARAAAAFRRLADLFPGSRHRAAALYGAGLALQRLGEWRPALERFLAVEREFPGRDADQASFRVSECWWHLGDLGQAQVVLDRLARRGDLEPQDHVRALAWRGVVELEQGHAEAAEASLREAVQAGSEAGDRDRLDDSAPAQAQFYLGEVYRRRFQEVQIDPSRDGAEALEKALELKAELLLSAQGHYLRAVRMGNPEWTVASGYRIGELYDDLYGHLTQAALPPGLDAGAEAAYRAELAAKVRVLVTKAIAIYESTIEAARRAGVANAVVEKTAASLARMRQALALSEVAGSGSAAPPDPGGGQAPGGGVERPPETGAGRSPDAGGGR